MKMRVLFISFIVTLSVVFVLSGQTAGQQKQAPAKVANADQAKQLFTRYCQGCHSVAGKKAGVESAMRMQIDALDIAHIEKDPETWEHVVRKTRSGMMPPSGMPRPDAATFEGMISFVEKELDRTAVAKLPPPGLHRLNRSEYANAVRDLIGLDVDPAKYLPPDDSGKYFDNIAASLTLSPALLEGYMSAAGKISRMAVGDVSTPISNTYRVPEDTSQDYHVEGMPSVLAAE